MDVPRITETTLAPTMNIESINGRTCIEVDGEEITPEEAEGWTIFGKRVKQIIAGNDNGESVAIAPQPRHKTRAIFAKRVAASLTKAATMPIDMPR